MSRRLSFTLLVVALSILIAVPVYADPGKPDFTPQIYGDGEEWGTKATTSLPAPNEHNRQSFDALWHIPGQLPVSEAAPGNPDYNGGRWIVYELEWTVAPYDDPLTNATQVKAAMDAGYLVPTGDAPGYVQCPLLPAKE
jgi:hypothetical protein